eukprot:CAMPEP_0185734698 /NCGR_PEP_ID=MMETSP1171-20130828/23175_1 /TAXON_ID=374046 /ORGANISM="Helicotheca tamensis, Strain CCMP826" /LENGTH=538 /DNA_ID=CAMNT_0028404761 /DNA_START=54 /DNA_END=1670 /DNA_ORIENTATION=-
MGRRRKNSNAEHKTREQLWKGAHEKGLGEKYDGAVVQMVGIESAEHTAYARVLFPQKEEKETTPEDTAADTAKDPPPKVTAGKVVDTIVDEEWRHVAKDILEKGEHIEQDSYPDAKTLLKLGSVWLLNESTYTGDSHNAHAKRLSPEDASMTPDWNDFTLRIHFAPERFHASNEVDWSKYCRGLLVGAKVDAFIGGEAPHVPVAGLPDDKDGAIVYENDDLGFVVVNKPGSMPGHATLSNHAEDVVSMFTAALKERKKCDEKKPYVSLPQRLDIDTHGLLTVSTKKEFATYMSKLLENKTNGHVEKDEKNNSKKNKDAHPSDGCSSVDITKKYRCLVCVRDPDSMDVISNFQQLGTVITHYLDPKSPAPKRFLRNKPKNSNHEWQQCQMRILRVGDERFRAACVSSNEDYVDSMLSHQLWGNKSETPAEDLGVSYVMELEIELLTGRTHQIRGQLKALGFPIVGDPIYGGGVSEFRSHMHGWNRMALQCCELAFPLPKWVETEDKKGKALSASEDKKCVFRLNEAWWTPYLGQYYQNL